MVIFGCCVGSWPKFDAYVRPHIPTGAEVCALGGQRSIVRAYNAIIEFCYKHIEETDALVLLHDDLELTGDGVADQILSAAARFEVTGVIGPRFLPRDLAWWNYDVIGWQETDSGPVGPRLELADVSAVDGSIMILSPWAINHIRFDPAYPGFHGYDVDYCRQVIEGGGVVGVYPIPTHHHSTLGFKSPQIEASWHEADAIYRAKWEG